MEDIKTILIIPAYNEEENIKRVVDNIRLNYSQFDYLVVNDDLHDATASYNRGSNIDFRVKLGIGPDEPLVLFVGRLEPEKGCEQLVGAAKLLSKQGVQFVLAGEGRLRDAIEAEELSNVHLLGNVAQDDLAALMLQSDCFCLPSRSEGFCTSLLESSACGLLAAITDVGGARELIPDASYGSIVPSAETWTVADAVSCFLNLDIGERKAMGERCRSRVERCYNWGSTVCALESAFGDDVIQESYGS